MHTGFFCWVVTMPVAITPMVSIAWKLTSINWGNRIHVSTVLSGRRTLVAMSVFNVWSKRRTACQRSRFALMSDPMSLRLITSNAPCGMMQMSSPLRLAIVREYSLPYKLQDFTPHWKSKILVFQQFVPNAAFKYFKPVMVYYVDLELVHTIRLVTVTNKCGLPVGTELAPTQTKQTEAMRRP